MIILFYTFGAVFALLLLGAWIGQWRNTLVVKKHDRSVRKMSLEGLCREASRSAEQAGLRSSFPDAQLFQETKATSFMELSAQLDDLWNRAKALDKKKGLTGTERYTHFFYDFGLIRVMETLKARIAEERYGEASTQ